MRVLLVVSELLPIDDEDEELGVEVLALVSVDEVVEPVVPLAPMPVELVLEPAEGAVLDVLGVEPLAPIVDVLEEVLGVVALEDVLGVEVLEDVLGVVVLEDVLGVEVLDELTFAPPPPAAPDWAIATPPMAMAAAAASVVRIFLDMS